MAAGALILVRCHIGERFAPAIVVLNIQGNDCAGPLQIGIGLIFVPDIGNGDPACRAVGENARFDKARPGQGKGCVYQFTRGTITDSAIAGFVIIECLCNDCTDRKIKNVVLAVIRQLTFRQSDSAQFHRIVREQRRGKIVWVDIIAKL